MYDWLKKEDGTLWTDDMPQGWYHRFGDFMIERLHLILEKHDMADSYSIIEMSESYGFLKIEDNCPHNKDLNTFKNKIKELSRDTCVFCGAPEAVLYEAGWVHPACDKCKPPHKPPKKIKQKEQVEMYDWENHEPLKI